MKYQLNEKFHFSYEEPSDFYIENDKNLNLCFPKIQELEKYSEYLYSYGWLEDYLYNPSNDNRINYVLYNMTYAKKLNSRDIWPQYWTAYFQTDKAIYSNKKSDYQKALKSWEELLQNDLLYASPVFKLTYQKMALCQEKLGNSQMQQFYLEKEKGLSPVLDFDYKNYVYFGY